MDPIAFEIGALSIRWYGVMAALGFVAAMFLLEYNRKFAALNKDQCSTLLFMAMVSGILGARIFYVVQFFHYYRDNLWNIIRIDQGGLVFYGGFILAAVIFAGWCFFKKEKPLALADLLSTVVPLGHAFGRIGCFFYGCCYGKQCDCAAAVTFPRGSPAWYEQLNAGQIASAARESLPARKILPLIPPGNYAFIKVIDKFGRVKGEITEEELTEDEHIQTVSKT